MLALVAHALSARLVFMPVMLAQGQPLAYSHKLHIAKGLTCLDCHSTADVSAAAPIPSVNKCMLCHAQIGVDKPEIVKLSELRQPNVRSLGKNPDRVGLASSSRIAPCVTTSINRTAKRRSSGPVHRLSRTRKRHYIAVRIRFGGQLMPAFAKKDDRSRDRPLLDWLELKTGPPAIPSLTQATASGGAR